MAIGFVKRTVIGAAAGAAATNLPKAAPGAFSSAMVTVINLAIDGTTGFPSAKRIAAKALQRHAQVGPAIDSLVRQHTALAGAGGVVSNIGGIVAAIVGTPVNITGIIVIQTRLVAGIAHLRGYDIDDPRVRTAVAMCLLGEEEVRRQIAAGRLPSTPLAVATAAVHDPHFHTLVADRVLRHILGQAGGHSLFGTVIRAVPLVGGAICGLDDLNSTAAVGRYARTHLLARRPVTPNDVPLATTSPDSGEEYR